mmetsp:Transcript_18716/g.54121  ORF Transcript_18716/g.54121 Transcript_18716/m.54121 type:complete len:135 (+) Transcript_18716:112-516(+)
MITVGTPAKLRRFLEVNPTIPQDRIFVDDSDGYEVYKAMGFGKLTDGIPDKIETLQLRIPGFDLGSAFNYLTNVAWLAPVRSLSEGVPEGVTLLSGTFAFTKERMLHASSDRVPGDYAAPRDVLDDAEALLAQA